MHSLKRQLSSQGMVQLYESRLVNSIYFDNKVLQMYFDSEEGILPREKVRIRWYNRDEQYQVETKISSIEGRFKKSNVITNQVKNTLITCGLFNSRYGQIHPKIKVAYTRHYYLFKGVRVTFDQNITYEDYRSNTTIKDFECVMEVKASADYTDDEFLFQFGSSDRRFSKYARACHLTKFSLI